VGERRYWLVAGTKSVPGSLLATPSRFNW
jgi:hypothetical protein